MARTYTIIAEFPALPEGFKAETTKVDEAEISDVIVAVTNEAAEADAILNPPPAP